MSLRAALLTMIGNEPRSGYELKSSFETSLGFVWQATHQQIYQELKKLVAEGLADVDEVAARGRQTKKLYSLTPAGERALREWLDAEAVAGRHQIPLLIKFFAGERVDIARLRADLANVKARAAATRTQLEAIERSFAGDGPEHLPIAARLGWLALRRGQIEADAELRWVEECERWLPRPKPGGGD